jgi:hypothetical protein
MPSFPATRHSVIERMRSADEGARGQAFGDLVGGYWKPLQRYLCVHWRLSDDDAQETTQSFFAEAFQKDWLARYDPQKARFRTFLRVCVDRFVLNRQQAAARAKRGGGVEMMAFEALPEGDLPSQLTNQPDAEDLFRRDFVRALFERAVEQTRAEYEPADKRLHFTLFERYDLDPSDGVSYASLAREFNLTPAQVTNGLAQVRRRFREHAIEALRGLCASEDEFRRESADIFGVELE